MVGFDEWIRMEKRECFDFKCVNSELAAIDDGVKRFLKYRMIDCEDRDTLDLTADIYVNLYGATKNDTNSSNRYFTMDGVLLESDTMNSFWTTYRALLECCMREVCKGHINVGVTKEIIYEFIVIFGGVNPYIKSNNKLKKSVFKNYSMEDDIQTAYQYFADYENARTGDSKWKLDHYVTYCLTGQASGDELQKERYQWLFANHEKIKQMIETVGGEDFYLEVEKFAKLTHAAGNYCLVPYRFNIDRASLTADYWDLSLVTLQGYSCKENWYGEGVRWFSRHFSDVLKLDDYFLKLHKDSFCESEVKPLFYGHSFGKKKPENMKEFKDLVSNVNYAIEKRGESIYGTARE